MQTSCPWIEASLLFYLLRGWLFAQVIAFIAGEIETAL